MILQLLSVKFRQIPFSGSKMWKVNDDGRTTDNAFVPGGLKRGKTKVAWHITQRCWNHLNKQVKIKNLKNNASPKNKICSNISYFMQVRMKLCQSKEVDPLFLESLLYILTLKSAALTFIPLLPSLLSPLFSPIKLFMRSEVRKPHPPTLPPGKYSSSVPVMHFVLKRDGITTNGRTDGRSIRLTDAPADLSGRV